MVFSEVISCTFSSSNWQYDCLETCINMNSSICNSHQRRMNCIFQLKTFHFGIVQYVHCVIHSFIIQLHQEEYKQLHKLSTKILRYIVWLFSTVNSQSGVIFSLLIRKAWLLVLLSIPLIFCNLTHPVGLSKYFWTWKNAQQNLTPKEIRDIFCSAL